VENLTLTGTVAINGTGNTDDNVLTGNSGVNTLTGDAGNDVLDGKAGADTMKGGAGNDTYYVDNASDVVTELVSEGTDTVISSISYTLGANVENLRINATGALNATGNTADNILYAGAGNNVLNGLGGTDTASYLYASAAVTVSLASASAQSTGGSGSDTLTNMENLEGSVYNDTLTGNTAANVLQGGLGNDTLNGAAGNDTLYGGLGNNTYLFGKGDGSDTIQAMLDATVGKLNVLRFKAGVAASEVRVTRSGDSLVLGIAGTTDVVTVVNFFYTNTPTNSNNPVQEVRFADGTVWDLAAIQEQLSAPKQFSIGNMQSGYMAEAEWTESAEMIFSGSSRPYALPDETFFGEKKPFAVDAQMVSPVSWDGLLDSQINQLLSAMASFAPPAGMAQDGILAGAYQQAPLGSLAVSWQ
jgi:hypothetical protein